MSAHNTHAAAATLIRCADDDITLRCCRHTFRFAALCRRRFDVTAAFAFDYAADYAAADYAAADDVAELMFAQ